MKYLKYGFWTATFGLFVAGVIYGTFWVLGAVGAWSEAHMPLPGWAKALLGVWIMVGIVMAIVTALDDWTSR